MSSAMASKSVRKTRAIILLSIGFGLIVLLAANTHLLYVAVSSEPDCVAHFRAGERNGANSFSAATSSCSSKPLAGTQVE